MKEDDEDDDECLKIVVESADLDADRFLDNGINGTDSEKQMEPETFTDDFPELERNINDCASRNNLGVRNIKQILKYVIGNREVLDMLSSDMKQRTASGEAGSTALTFEPAMTRSRVKRVVESGEALLPPGAEAAPWALALTTPCKKKKQKGPTFGELELREDDDDEDFDPAAAEDDDDEDVDEIDSLFSPNASSIASPPVATSNPPSCNSAAAPNRPIDDESDAEKMLDDAPAKRTRQRVCLKDKPLEVLEGDFVAPDVDPEMFESAGEDDADAEYLHFLREFYTKPATNTMPSKRSSTTAWAAPLDPAEVSEKEDDDPDYNILEDIDQDIETDPEEFQQNRATEVSKKELDELLDELLNASNDEDDDCFGFSEQILGPPPSFSRDIPVKPKPFNDKSCAEARPNFSSIGKTIFTAVDVHGSRSPLMTTPSLSPNDASSSEPPVSTDEFPSTSAESTPISTEPPVTSGVTLTIPLNGDSSILASLPLSTTSLQINSIRSLLNQQISQHIQLLTQIFVLAMTSSRPEEYQNLANEAKKLIEEVSRFSTRSRDGAENGSSCFSQIPNLVSAVEVVSQSTPLILAPDSEKEINALRKAFQHSSSSEHEYNNPRKKIQASVPPLCAMRFFSNVPAFPYPSLLPAAHALSDEERKTLKRNKHFQDVAKNKFSESEDNLIAIGWSQYIAMNVPKTKAIRYVHELLLPNRTTEQLQIRIKNVLSSRTNGPSSSGAEDVNAVKYLKTTCCLPPRFSIDKVEILPQYFNYDAKSGNISHQDLFKLITWFPIYEEASVLHDESVCKKPVCKKTVTSAASSDVETSIETFVAGAVDNKAIIIIPDSCGVVYASPSAVSSISVNSGPQTLSPESKETRQKRRLLPRLKPTNLKRLKSTETNPPLETTPENQPTANESSQTTAAVTLPGTSLTTPANTTAGTTTVDAFSETLMNASTETISLVTPLIQQPIPPAPLDTQPTSSALVSRWGTLLMDDILKAAMDEAEIDDANGVNPSSPFKSLFTDSPLKTPFISPTKENFPTPEVSGFRTPVKSAYRTPTKRAFMSPFRNLFTTPTHSNLPLSEAKTPSPQRTFLWQILTPTRERTRSSESANFLSDMVSPHSTSAKTPIKTFNLSPSKTFNSVSGVVSGDKEVDGIDSSPYRPSSPNSGLSIVAERTSTTLSLQRQPCEDIGQNFNLNTKSVLCSSDISLSIARDVSSCSGANKETDPVPESIRESITSELSLASSSQTHQIKCENFPSSLLHRTDDMEERRFGFASEVAAQVSDDLDLSQLMAASTTTNFNPDARPIGGTASSKKKGAASSSGALSSAHFAEEINRMMNDPDLLENDPLIDERNVAYGNAFLTKVRETFGETDVEIYRSVLMALRRCADRGDPVRLFGELKELFLPRWPELLDDFVPFLLPEQALECGVLSSYNQHSRVKRFLRRCEIFFNRRPAQYTAVIKALHLYVSRPLDATVSSELHETVLPLLKGQKELLQDFFAFFPNDRRDPRVDPSDTGFEETTLPEEDENIGADENGVVWECVRLGLTEADREGGGKHCQCRCHEDEEASQSFRSRSRHCVPCAKTIVDGRYYIRTSQRQKEEADIVYIRRGTTKPRTIEAEEATEVEEGGKSDKENEVPQNRTTSLTTTPALEGDSSTVLVVEPSTTSVADLSMPIDSDRSPSPLINVTTVSADTPQKLVNLETCEDGGVETRNGVALLSISDSGDVLTKPGFDADAVSANENCEEFVFTVSSGRAPESEVNSNLAGRSSTSEINLDSAEENGEPVPSNKKNGKVATICKDTEPKEADSAVTAEVSVALNNVATTKDPVQTTAAVTQDDASWTNDIDIALLQKCQREGPNPTTYAAFVQDFKEHFPEDASMARSLGMVERRLIYLMDKLEAMQETDGDTSDSTEDDSETE